MKLVKILILLGVIILLYDIFLGNIFCFKVISKFFHVTPWSFTGEEYEGYKYRFFRPSDLKNSDKKYPLVIYLHGSGERGDDNRKQIYDLPHFGSGVNREARKFQKEYPCFVYIPQCPSKSDWNNEDVLTGLVKTINKLLTDYPIDSRRLYLFGYSMGGSGTYSLAKKFYDINNYPFAVVVRFAGYNAFSDDVHGVISKSYVWLHVGQNDSPSIVNKVREAYSILKDKYKNGSETSQQSESGKHKGTTVTIAVNGVEKVKKSEYFNVGHAISNFPFKNFVIHKWVFSKSIEKKYFTRSK